MLNQKLLLKKVEKNQEIEISKLKEEKNKLFETENINLIICFKTLLKNNTKY